ncbi:21162_t:CDS:1, partial [Rhizophagus irregularis]
AHKRKVEQMESKEYLRAKELQERLRQRIRQINEKEKAKQEHE